MRIVLSAHARRRLAERSLGESDVERVIRRPQKPERDADGNPIYTANLDGMYIRVVVRKGSTPPYVITVFFN